MNQSVEEAVLTDEGVAFTVQVDFVKRDCLISLDALAKLSSMRSGTAPPLEVFHAFEPQIRGVARRLVAANVPGTPLRLGPNSFH